MTTILQRLFGSPGSTEEEGEVSFTLAEVADHCHRFDCWVVIGDHVYDITPFLDKHPGGFEVLLENAGRDATVAFFGAGHHPDTVRLMETFRIGSLAQHERISHYGKWHSLQASKVTVVD